jgi:hypothetical protein
MFKSNINLNIQIILKNNKKLKFSNIFVKHFANKKIISNAKPIKTEKINTTKNVENKINNQYKNIDIDETKAINKTETENNDPEIQNLEKILGLSPEAIKPYHEELRNSIANYEEAPRNLKYFLILHLVPSLFVINKFFMVNWVYQIFWAGASLGIVYTNYEFYSNSKEKQILHRHVHLMYNLLNKIDF